MRAFKLLLLAVTIALSSLAQANCLDADGILRAGDSSLAPEVCDGELVFMNHRDATLACPVGTRLPTVFEFALESEARGAQGILRNSDGSIVSREQVQTRDVWRPVGSTLVSYLKDSSKAPTADNIATFYFKYDGYRRPQNDLGTELYWSSSVFASFPHGAYVFGGRRGDVDAGGFYHSYINAVRCISNR